MTKSISDLAEVCIGCGRPIFPKSQQRADTGGIFSDSPSEQIKEQKVAEESNSSLIGFIVLLFLVIALLTGTVAGSRPKTSHTKPSDISQTGVSEFLSSEGAALEMAIHISRSRPDASLDMQIAGYKSALEELDKIKNAHPTYKIDLIASLTNEFITQKLALEAKLKKLETDLAKEAEARSPQTKKEAEEIRVQLEKEAKEREQKQKQLAARLKKLERNFRVKKDEVTKTDFLTHKTFPVYADSRSCIYPYIGRSGYSRWLRIKIQYTSSSWLFVEKLIFSIDDENVVKEFDHFEWKRDNDGGSIWEWIDLSGDIKLEELLEKIAKSKKTILRFEGRQYYKDITISAADKKAILETIDYYKAF